MHEAQDHEISCYIYVSLSLSCIIIAHFDKLTWMKFIVIVITITFSCILIVVELPAPDRPSCIDTIGVIRDDWRWWHWSGLWCQDNPWIRCLLREVLLTYRTPFPQNMFSINVVFKKNRFKWRLRLNLLFGCGRNIKIHRGRYLRIVQFIIWKKLAGNLTEQFFWPILCEPCASSEKPDSLLFGFKQIQIQWHVGAVQMYSGHFCSVQPQFSSCRLGRLW